MTLLWTQVGCDGGDGSDPADPAPDFTLTDTNADSPSYGQARSLAEAQGRVIVLQFIFHSRGICVSQFAILEQMLQQWRADGYDPEDVEVWTVARSGDEGSIDSFASGSTSSCFLDGASVFSAYDAAKDDVFIIDREGRIRHRFDSGEDSLSNSAQREKVDGWVRALL